MSENDSRYDSTVHGNNHSDSGMLHVPADVQRDLGVCIDTELEVTMSGIEDEFINSVTFEATQTAGDSVTVPARLMRRLGFDGGESVLTEFALADDEESEESEESDLSQSQGALDSESESEDEEENEGLGELFG